MSRVAHKDRSVALRPAARSAPADLVQLAQRRAPTGAVVATIELADGTRLRTARWAPEATARDKTGAPGTVLICTGRGEFIEKYFEVVGDLLGRGFAVVVFDWRGQGLSTRLLRDVRKGHVADFAEFEADLAAVVKTILEPFCPVPFFALAHSMGGTVVLRHARRGHCAFERIVLSAPMIEIHDLPLQPALRHLARALTLTGFGGRFLPQGKRTSVLEKGFDNNVLTSDPVRFADMMAVSSAEPRLLVGAPTIGWLNAAFEAMLPFEDSEFAARLTVPVLMVVPGGDRVISVAAMERFGRRLKAGRSITIPYAQHEILMERDPLRDQFWAAFDAFIPGTSPEAQGRSAP